MWKRNGQISLLKYPLTLSNRPSQLIKMFSLSTSSELKVTNLHIHRARCLVLGQPMVGKTLLVRRLLALASDQLVNVDIAASNESNVATNLSDLKGKNHLLADRLEPQLRLWQCPDLPVELLILDCSGRSLYQDWLSKLADCRDWLIVGVFDLTSSSSLSFLREQITRLLPSTGTIATNKSGLTSSGFGTSAKTVPLSSVQSNENNPARLGVLIGTRADLKRQVRSEEALQLAHQFKFGYFECNTCEGAEVQLPFRFLAENIVQLTSNQRL